MPDHVKPFDVVVAGGGVGGAIAALLLARAGAEVVIVDRGSRSRGAIEIVSGRARRLLKHHVDAFALQGLPGHEVLQTISLWNTSAPVSWSAICNPWGAGFALDRNAFRNQLQSLAKKSGVLIINDADIRSVERSDGLIELSLRRNRQREMLRAEFLILATGRAQTQFVPRKTVSYTDDVTLISHVTNNNDETDQTLYLEAAAEGWWASLPHPDKGQCVTLSIAGAKLMKRHQSMRELWQAQLQRTRLFAPLLSRMASGEVITGCSSGIRSFDRVCGKSWMAVGDAAFACDPLSGEGIEFAIDSSVHAVRVLLEGAQSESLRDYHEPIQGYAVNHERIRDMHLASAGIRQN